MTVCQTCNDSGHVCEAHHELPWGGLCCTAAALSQTDRCEHGACGCGAPGQPCGSCCDPIPNDGKLRRIDEAFTPRHLKADT